MFYVEGEHLEENGVGMYSKRRLACAVTSSCLARRDEARGEYQDE
jgi:hypothetical protein